MLSPLDQERERSEQWRRLALQLDKHRMDAWQLLRDTLTGPPDPTTIRRFLATTPDLATHQHVARGSQYVFLGFGKVQSNGWYDTNKAGVITRRADMLDIAIYRAVKDDSLWARPKEEWEDGRFIKL